MNSKPKKSSPADSVKETPAAIPSGGKRKLNVGNDPMIVTAFCPPGETGSPSPYPVPANKFFAQTKKDANDRAYQWGLQEATKLLNCSCNPITFRFRSCGMGTPEHPGGNNQSRAVVTIKQIGAVVDTQEASCGCSDDGSGNVSCSDSAAEFSLNKGEVYDYEIVLTDINGQTTNSSGSFTAQCGKTFPLGD